MLSVDYGRGSPAFCRLDLLQCSQHAWLHGAITSTCALLVPESPQDQEVDEEGGAVLHSFCHAGLRVAEG